MDCTTCCGCCCYEMPEAARLMLIGMILTYVLGGERLNHLNNYNLGFCRLKSCQCAGTPSETMEISETFHANHSVSTSAQKCLRDSR